MLDSVTDIDLVAIAGARAAAREVAWAQRAEATGVALAASMVVGEPLLARDGRPVLVIDEDAALGVAHSEKHQTRPTFKHTFGFHPVKHTFGFHPVLAFCDNTNEALTGMLRPGGARSNIVAADHITVVDAALAKIPADTTTAPPDHHCPRDRV